MRFHCSSFGKLLHNDHHSACGVLSKSGRISFLVLQSCVMDIVKTSFASMLLSIYATFVLNTRSEEVNFMQWMPVQ